MRNYAEFSTLFEAFPEKGLILMAINLKTTKDMAKIKNGFLDHFEGKLGPAVGYQWKGRACVRSLQTYIHDPRTAAQVVNRSRFCALSRLASDMLPVVRIGFRGPAREGQTSEYNCFIRTNKQNVNLVDNEVQVDYTALTVADGPLPTVAFGQPQAEGALTVRVPFEVGDGCPRDYVLLYAYAPALQSGQLALPVYRLQGLVVATLPAAWAGLEVHLYTFCWDRDQQASPSTYLGNLIV